MPSKFKSLLGSKRPSYFRELKSRPMKFRPQRVKFRRRYASSVMSNIGSRLLVATRNLAIISSLVAVAYYGYFLWVDSSMFKISEIQFMGRPPNGIAEFLPIKEGQNIFKFNARQLETASLATFRELRSIEINRHLSRLVTVEFAYRKPLAFLDNNGKKMGVDREGVIFPMNDGIPVDKLGPELIGLSAGPELTSTAQALSTISQELPDFYSLIRFIKTDRIQPLRLVFRDESVVYWGELNSTTVVGRAKKMQQVFREFSPKKSLASVRFVTDDRIVLDSQWQKKGGGQLGKT